MAKRTRRAAPTHDDEDTMTEKTPKKPTTLDLATTIDAAVRDVETRRQAVDVARVALEAATQDYSAAVETLTALRAEFTALMDGVLSDGGTTHVAKP